MSLGVERALANYPNWLGVDRSDRRPVIVGPLGDDSNNQSVLVANRSAFVIRVNVRDPAVNALDWRAEQAALMHAADAGLSPALRDIDPQTGTLVCDFLEADPAPSSSLKLLAKLLRDIHHLPPIQTALSLTERIVHYESLLQADEAKSEAASPIMQFSRIASECAAQLQERDTHKVLCHNDLLPANRLLSKGKLWAIDWEYAAMGSRWFDLAVVACGESPDKEVRETLLEHYLGRLPERHERRQFNRASMTYRYLEALWIAANRDVSDSANLVSLLETESKTAQTGR